jgi:hypothetical protein
MLNDMFLNALEKKMLEIGYESFNLKDKNEFVSYLADKNALKYSDLTDEYILNHHKKLKIADFSERCEKDIIDGFIATNGHKYRTNRDDQKNFFGKALELMIAPTVISVLWKTEDVGYITHSRQEWIDVFMEGVSHKETILHKYNTLKTNINNAVTEAELLLITWE